MIRGRRKNPGTAKTGKILPPKEPKKRKVTPPEERETIISQYPEDEDKISVYTSCPSFLRRMRKLQKKHPEDVIQIHVDDTFAEWTIPEEFLVIDKPRVKKTRKPRKTNEPA